MKKEFSIAFGLALLASPALAGGHQPADTLFHYDAAGSGPARRCADTDPDLVNPWGLCPVSRQSLWVSDNGQTCRHSMTRLGMKVALDVNIPMGAPDRDRRHTAWLKRGL